MRVGLVSPYPWDVPGGVVAHIGDLAEALIARGHDVAVMSPVDDDEAPLPSYVTRAGRSIPVPYNGSVSRLLLGPVSAARVRRWLHDGDFDVLHVHSPETFSLSLLALGNAQGPIVATFHAANPKSRILSILQNPLQVYLEKLSGRIAVSPAARKTIVDHLGADAVVVPNGVHIAKFAGAAPLPGAGRGEGGAIGFVGRLDEARKGLDVLLAALPLIRRDHPDVRVLVAGPGKVDQPMEGVTVLGRAGVDADKARLLASVDVFAAPNTGGESFGIVLLEAMAAGAPIIASRLDAFARVLDDGRLGDADFGRGPRRPSRSAVPACCPRQRAVTSSASRPGTRWPATTGRSCRGRCCGSTRRPSRPAPVRVVEEPETVEVATLGEDLPAL